MIEVLTGLDVDGVEDLRVVVGVPRLRPPGEKRVAYGHD